MMVRGFPLVVGGLALLAAGCGGSGSTSTLTSPSLLAGSAGATVSGVVNGGTPVGSAALSTATGGMTVTVIGRSIMTTIDTSGRFALTGVPAGDVQLHFT